MLQAGTATTRTLDPAAGLLVQLLAWVAAGPRTYGETMDAWRTSCPRISGWEDALGEGPVQVNGAGAGTQGEATVSLTPAGRDRRTQAAEATATAHA